MKPLLTILLCLLSLPAWAQSPIDYPIVLIESPVIPGFSLPEAGKPWPKQPGARLTRFENGAKSVLVDVGPNEAIFDPCVSLDGKWVDYALCPDMTFTDSVYPPRPRGGSSLWRINVETGEKQRLTNTQPEPLHGRTWRADVGVFDGGPMTIAGGKRLFTSDRVIPGQNQVYIMDLDGKNVEKVFHFNTVNQLHPVRLNTGYVAVSLHENQGIRSALPWGYWMLRPDGSDFQSLFPAFLIGTATHFGAQAGNGSFAVVDYYHVSNDGFGSIRIAPIDRGFEHRMPVPGYDGSNGRKIFARKGGYDLTPWTTSEDQAAPLFNPTDDPITGPRVGKVTHPATAKDPNELFVTYSPGPVNNAGRPTNDPPIQCGIYRIPLGRPTTGPEELTVVVDDPNWHEYQAQALVPYTDLFPEGMKELPFQPKSDSPYLPDGAPHGIIGSSTMFLRETVSMLTNGGISAQGGNAKEFDSKKIRYLRILGMQVPGSANHLYHTALNGDEKLSEIGLIDLWRFDANGNRILDPHGNPDTSWWAKVRAHEVITFQLLDEFGNVLTTSMTWHSVQAMATELGCFGCHQHTDLPADKPKFDFAQTWAAAHAPVDFTKSIGRLVEYTRDVKPILEEHGCIDCHTQGTDGAPLLTFAPPYNSLSSNDARPYRNAVKPLWEPFGSLDSKLVFHLTTDELSKRMPRGRPPMPPEQIRVIVDWINLGGTLKHPDSDEAFWDETKPTLYVSRDKVLIGAADANLESVTATLNGTPLTLTATDGVYRPTTPATPEGELTVVAKDEQGNETRIVRTFRGEPEPPPPPPPPMTLKQRLEALRDELEGIIQDVP